MSGIIQILVILSIKIPRFRVLGTAEKVYIHTDGLHHSCDWSAGAVIKTSCIMEVPASSIIQPIVTQNGLYT